MKPTTAQKVADIQPRVDFSQNPRMQVQHPRKAHAAVLGLVCAASLLLLPGQAAAADAPATCPVNFKSHGGSEPLTCSCPSGVAVGNVWGTDTYTSDSSVCRAALHAGAVTEEGGVVTVYPAPGQSSYIGTSRNGVATSNYGAWGSSFSFEAKDAGAASTSPTCPATFKEHTSAEALTCVCPPGLASGTVWGTDIYTNDSSVCRAAVHAGVITTDGGSITAHPAPGQASYIGTNRNGVTTSNYGAWGSSFRF